MPGSPNSALVQCAAIGATAFEDTRLLHGTSIRLTQPCPVVFSRFSVQVRLARSGDTMENINRSRGF